MAVLTVYTVQFDGEGQLACRRCGRATVFPDSQWLILMDTGHSTLTRSALDGCTLHRCDWEQVYVCRDCGREQAEPPVRPIPRGRRPRRPVVSWQQHECEACGSVDLQLVARPLASGQPG